MPLRRRARSLYGWSTILKIGFQDNFPVPNPIPLFYPDLVWASEQTLIITAAGCAFV